MVTIWFTNGPIVLAMSFTIVLCRPTGPYLMLHSAWGISRYVIKTPDNIILFHLIQISD